MSNYRVDMDMWRELTFVQQMANIGAEVGRSIKATRKNQTNRANSAIDRALELLYATIECNTSGHHGRLKELLRIRDEYLKLFFEGTFDQDADNIEKYFMHFATAESRQK